ncbi:MAG: endonuclease/exonuclease/phosphatase family protein [Chthoniobacteraceae bacterium]
MNSLRVASFNVWSDAPKNAHWPARKDVVGEALRRCEFDLAGLQEPTVSMIEDLQRALPEYGWIGAGRADGNSAGEFTPIFYRSARFERLKSETFWLAPDPKTPGRGWDAACPRIVTWARFFDRAANRELAHFNTHFDHLGYRARRQSAHQLLNVITELDPSIPVILTGDLNSRDSSAAYRILTGKIPFAQSADFRALRDTFYASEKPRVGPRRTYRGLLGLFGLGRIDYIFTNSRLRTLQHTVRTDCPGASDHWPVTADLFFA